MKPEECRYCGSPRLVPNVNGDALGPAGLLDTLGRVCHWGCFSIEVGDPLWSCVDCGQSVDDPEFAKRERDDEVMQTYRETVAAAFASYREPTHQEHRRIRGLWALKSEIRGHFHANVAEVRLRRLGEYRHVTEVVHDDGSVDLASESRDARGAFGERPSERVIDLYLDQLGMMQELLVYFSAARREQLVRVRVGRVEADFEVQADGPDALTIRCVAPEKSVWAASLPIERKNHAYEFHETDIRFGEAETSGDEN